MRTHILKTWTEYYERVQLGTKPFEVRKNDRDFQAGDILILQDYNPETKEYSGRTITKYVTYVLTGGSFGIEQGYAVLGLSDSLTSHPIKQ